MGKENSVRGQIAFGVERGLERGKGLLVVLQSGGTEALGAPRPLGHAKGAKGHQGMVELFTAISKCLCGV